MYDIEGSLDQQILQTPRNRPTVLFTEPQDPRVLEAAFHLVRFVRPVFLAPEQAVRQTCRDALDHLDPNRIEYALSESAFVDPEEHPDLVEEFAGDFQAAARHEGRTVSSEEARSAVRHPGLFGIMAARLGHADMVVGGAVHEPRAYYRPMTRLLTRSGFCTEAGVFVLPDSHPQDIFPHNIVVFGDVGVNATVTPEILAQIAVGTCAVARDLIPEEVLPVIRGVLVSYSHKGSDEGPSPDLVRRASNLLEPILERRIQLGPRFKSIQLRGEVKASVALSQRSATFYESGGAPWEGAPTVIVCPNLEMGNMLYHLYATSHPDARHFSVMFGLGFRGVSLARDCSPEDVRLSVKAAVLRMHRCADWKRTPRETFFPRARVLAVNPGSTSTKISVYHGEEELFTRELQHSAEELLPFEGRPLSEQFRFRRDAILGTLSEHGLGLGNLDAVAARGGMLAPIPHGTYLVGPQMLEELREARWGEHASNLGAMIASELVAGTDKPAFIVDPVVVDELPERVRITGVKTLRRRAISHALNQFATARRYAEEHETFYERLNLVVCHMGGGISVGAHKKGCYIDVNNALDGEGPFSPQRSGSLPVGQLLAMCFSGRYTHQELKLLNKGRGGMIDLLGTADMREVERRVEAGDREAGAAFEAMVYRIAKEITSLLPAFDGEPVDQVLLTGGMARSRLLVEKLRQYLAAFGCGVTVYPGENEMAALVKGALRVLSGREQARTYPPT